MGGGTSRQHNKDHCETRNEILAAKSPSHFVTSVQASDEAITCVLCTPRVLFTASRNGDVRSWSMKKGRMNQKLLNEFKGHHFWVECMCHDAPRERLYTGSADNVVRVWNDRTGLCEFVLSGHKNDVSQLVLAGSGLMLYSGSRDGTVRAWDTVTGDFVEEYKGHSSWVESIWVDEPLLFTCSFDKTARVWNTETGVTQHILAAHTSNVQKLVVDKNTKTLYTASWDKSIIAWDYGSGEVAHTYTDFTAHVTDVKLINNDVFSGSEDGIIRRHMSEEPYRFKMQYRGHVGAVKCFDAFGDFLYSGGVDASVHVFLLRSAEPIGVWRGHAGAVNSLFFGASRFLLSAGDDGCLVTWKLMDRKDVPPSLLRAAELSEGARAGSKKTGTKETEALAQKPQKDLDSDAESMSRESLSPKATMLNTIDVPDDHHHPDNPKAPESQLVADDPDDLLDGRDLESMMNDEQQDDELPDSISRTDGKTPIGDSAEPTRKKTLTKKLENMEKLEKKRHAKRRKEMDVDVLRKSMAHLGQAST
jgi:WD40 repeat protein